MTQNIKTSPLNIVVLVSGRGTNLQALINASRSGKIKSVIKAVISNKPDVLALTRARRAGIPNEVVLSSGRTTHDFFFELKQRVVAHQPDLIILAGFMKILPPDFVGHYKNRIINIHPALLPAFPGLNAQAKALAAGVKITGCTVHFVDDRCDAGPIILQTSLAVRDVDTAESLALRLLKKEHQTLIKAVQLIEDNKVILQGQRTLLGTQ